MGGPAVVCTLRVPPAERGSEVVKSWCRYHRAVGFRYAFLFFDDPLLAESAEPEEPEEPSLSSFSSSSSSSSSSSPAWPPPHPPVGVGLLDHVPAAVAVEREFGAKERQKAHGGPGRDDDDATATDVDVDDDDDDDDDERFLVVVVAGQSPRLRAWQRQHCPSWASYEAFLGDEVQARQTMNAEAALVMAAHRGADWLLHIDSDELFYTGPPVTRELPPPPASTAAGLQEGGTELVATAAASGSSSSSSSSSSSPSSSSSSSSSSTCSSVAVPSAVAHFAELDREGVYQMTYVNHEGVPERPGIVDYFSEVTLFRQHHFTVPLGRGSQHKGARDAMRFWERRTNHGQYLLVYDNGKSATRVLPGVRAKSVHSWLLPPHLEEQHQRRFQRREAAGKEDEPGGGFSGGGGGGGGGGNGSGGGGAGGGGGGDESRPVAVVRRRTALADPRSLDVSAVRRCEHPCILHFVTCGLRWFADKYEILGAFDDSWFGGKLPIAPSFHLDARDVVLAASTGDGTDGCGGGGGGGGGGGSSGGDSAQSNPFDPGADPAMAALALVMQQQHMSATSPPAAPPTPEAPPPPSDNHDATSAKAVRAFFEAQVLFDTEGTGESGAAARAELSRQLNSGVCRRITTVAQVLRGGPSDGSGGSIMGGAAHGAADQDSEDSKQVSLGDEAAAAAASSQQTSSPPPPPPPPPQFGGYEKAWILSSIAQNYL